MVYDDARNFIGDTHWRGSGPVQDGDELQLDKGVLIQLGEEIARTEQDLTKLLEKRKKAPYVESSAPATVPPTSMPNPTPHSVEQAPVAVSSVLRPKSLNVLLGTPKGRLGRAALPQKSPHDLRIEALATQPVEERPVKRPRLTIAENPTAKKTTVLPASPAPRIAVRQSPPRPPLGNRQSSTARLRPQAATAAVLTSTMREHEHAVAELSDHSKGQLTGRAAEENASSKPPGPRSKGQKSAPEPLRKARDADAYSATSHNEATSEVRHSASNSPKSLSPPRTSRIRVTSGKPRRKLMYKDLLPKVAPSPNNDFPTPSIFHDVDDEADDTREEASASTMDPRLSNADSQSHYHRDQRQRIRERLRKHERKKAVEFDEQELAALAERGSEDAVDQGDGKVSALEKVPKVCTEGQDRGRPSPSVPSLSQAAMLLVEENKESLFLSPENPLRASFMNDVTPESHDGNPSLSRNTVLAPIAQQSTCTGLVPPKDPPPAMTATPPLPINIPLSSPIIARLPPLPPPPPPQVPLKTPRTPLARSHTVPSSVAKRAERTLRKTLSEAQEAQGHAPIPRISSKEAVPLEPQPWSYEAWELFGERREDVVRRVREREKGNRSGLN